VRVAAGDVDADGLADIVTGAGEGGGPQVTVVSGRTGRALESFMAYDAGFRGGVWVAAGDVDGNGMAEVVTGAGRGGSAHVEVFNNAGAVVKSFLAFGPTDPHTGGVRVGVADLNLDGRADVLASAGPGDMSRVAVTDAMSAQPMTAFLVYDPSFLGGVYVGGNG
jgi:serralysin